MIRDPDGLRVVWLFGRPYWWDRDGGRLTLASAATEPTRPPEPPTFDALVEMFSGPLPGPA